MNRQRRKEIENLAAQIEGARAGCEQVQGDEQEYVDNMPESFQNGAKGERAQAAADALEEAVQALEEAKEALERAME